jgi:hypothetical protein
LEFGRRTNEYFGLRATTEGIVNLECRQWTPHEMVGYLSNDPSPYRDHHWGDWAAAALLPDPLPWTQGLYNEVIGTPIDWVRAEALVELIDDWLPAARGEVKCVDRLIGILWCRSRWRFRSIAGSGKQDDRGRASIGGTGERDGDRMPSGQLGDHVQAHLGGVGEVELRRIGDLGAGASNSSGGIPR